MRLLHLDLIAYGSFADRRLELASPGQTGRLHIIYGPNEAGKSTALRALGGLLHGIPTRTRDNHRHRNQDLRIGARLEFADGSQLEFVRRKGNKNTLLDAEGQPADGARLTAALRGVDASWYASMFGMNHEDLRTGARALLDGQGHVGETLFQAGTGGANISALLATLEEEAGAIFKSRGSKPELNRAVKLHRDLRGQVRESALEVKEWTTLHGEREQLRTRVAEERAKKHELGVERQRIEADLRIVPLVAELDARREKRAQLGDLPQLPANAERERLEFQQRLETSRGKLEELDDQRRRAHARRDQLAEPGPLGELEPDLVATIEERKAQQRIAADQLPRHRSELAVFHRQIDQIVAELEPGSKGMQAARERLVALPERARVHQLGRQYVQLRARIDEQAERCADANTATSPLGNDATT